MNESIKRKLYVKKIKAKATGAAVAVFSFSFMGYGIWLFLDQILTFLQQGYWEGHSLLSFFIDGRTNLSGWLRNPESWFGLHKIMTWILDFLPLSLVSFSLGVFVLVATSDT